GAAEFARVPEDVHRRGERRAIIGDAPGGKAGDRFFGSGDTHPVGAADLGGTGRELYDLHPDVAVAVVLIEKLVDRRLHRVQARETGDSGGAVHAPGYVDDQQHVGLAVGRVDRYLDRLGLRTVVLDADR